MLFHPHRTPCLLVLALILLPKGFGFEFVPITFQILESAMTISEIISMRDNQVKLTQWPASVLAPP